METKRMTESIPLPARTARILALTSLNEVGSLEYNGFNSTSRRVENCAECVLEVATEDKGGEFVSIPRNEASTITAYGDIDASRTARVFLEQYGIW